MDLVKKNIVSIIFGVIALIAVVLWIVPVSGWYTELKGGAEKQAKGSSEITSLISTPREMPNTSTSTAAPTPVPLGRFPNQQVIDLAKQKMAEVHARAQEVLNTAIDINKRSHEVLVPGVFTKPTSA